MHFVLLAVFLSVAAAENTGICPSPFPTAFPEENILPGGEVAYQLNPHDWDVVTGGYQPFEEFTFEVVAHDQSFKHVNVSAYTDEEGCGIGSLRAIYRMVEHEQCDGVLHEESPKKMKKVKFAWQAPECGCVTIWSSVQSKKGQYFYDESVGMGQLSHTICRRDTHWTDDASHDYDGPYETNEGDDSFVVEDSHMFDDVEDYTDEGDEASGFIEDEDEQFDSDSEDGYGRVYPRWRGRRWQKTRGPRWLGRLWRKNRGRHSVGRWRQRMMPGGFGSGHHNGGHRVRNGMKPYNKHLRQGMRKPWKHHRMSWSSLEEKVEWVCMKISFKEAKQGMKHMDKRNWLGRIKDRLSGSLWNRHTDKPGNNHWKIENWTAERREEMKSCCELNGEDAVQCFLEVEKAHLDEYCEEGRPMGLWRKILSKRAKKPLFWLSECCHETGNERHDCISRKWQSALTECTKMKVGSSESRDDFYEPDVPYEETDMTDEDFFQPMLVVDTFHQHYPTDDFPSREVADIVNGFEDWVDSEDDLSGYEDFYDSEPEEFEDDYDDYGVVSRKNRPDRKHRIKLLKKRCCKFGKKTGRKTARRRWMKCSKRAALFAAKQPFVGHRLKKICKKTTRACCVKTPFRQNKVSTSTAPTTTATAPTTTAPAPTTTATAPTTATTAPTTTTTALTTTLATTTEFGYHIPEISPEKVAAVVFNFQQPRARRTAE